MEHLVEYTKTANGLFRCSQLCERISKVAVMVLKNMGSSMAASFEKWAGNFGMFGALLGLFRLPEATQTMAGALCNWSKGPVDGRGMLQKINDVTGSAAAWGYAVSLFTNNPVIKTVADAADLSSSTTDLVMARQDWAFAKELKGQATGDVQRRLADTQEHSFWKGMKSAISVFSGVLGLLVLAFGGPILPAATLLAIGLAGTCIAMYAHFFKETRPYEMVDFFKNRPIAVA